MKIAIVSDAIYPYNKGGKEKRIYELSRRLAAHNNVVKIYCMKWWKGQNTKKHGNVTYIAISPYFPLYSSNRRSIRQAIFFSLFCLKLLREDFDILEVDHMPHLVLLTTKIVAILKRKKLYVTWNEVWGRTYWMRYLGKLGLVASLIENITVKLPDHITSVSEYTTGKLIKELGVPKEKITTIPNGINLSYIQEVSPSSEQTDVIFAGRLLAHKNVAVLVDAISLLKEHFPQIKCMIIGEGPEKEQLKKQVDKLSLNKYIIFKDFVASDNELYGLMKSSKVFVLPSTREGFGIVVLEANAAGLPVITIQHPENAAKDLIQEGITGSISPLDKTLLANHIASYLKKSQRGNNYAKYIDKFEWDILAKRQEEVYMS